MEHLIIRSHIHRDVAPDILISQENVQKNTSKKRDKPIFYIRSISLLVALYLNYLFKSKSLKLVSGALTLVLTFLRLIFSLIIVNRHYLICSISHLYVSCSFQCFYIICCNIFIGDKLVVFVPFNNTSRRVHTILTH